MLEAVAQIDAGTAETRAHDESQATHQGLVDDETAAIDLWRPAPEIERLVRGCDPQPGAWLRVNAEPMRLYDAALEAGASGEPGTLLEVGEKEIRIALRGALLRVGRVRADAGKEPAGEFARRSGLFPGARFASA